MLQAEVFREINPLTSLKLFQEKSPQTFSSLQVWVHKYKNKKAIKILKQ